MAKIINLSDHATAPTKDTSPNVHQWIEWVDEMNALLKKIEQSLENTPTYASENINRRR